jgi:quercetin dioxygenase-like cupin family protein
MSDESESTMRPPRDPSGTAQRPAHSLSGPLQVFDLAAELDRLRQEPSWQGGDRNAKTLIGEADLRIVLTALKAGARLRAHRAPGPVSVQALAGRLRLHAAGETVELTAGRVLALGRDVPHDVEALEESAFLLTIGWSEGPRSRATG